MFTQTVPPRPEVVARSGQSKTIEVEYQVPKTRVVYDHFKENPPPDFACDDAIRAWSDARRNYEPVTSVLLDDRGQPQMEEIRESIRLAPSKFPPAFLPCLYAAVGTTLSVPVAVAVGASTQSLAGGLLTILAGAGLGALSGHLANEGYRADPLVASLEWREKPVAQRKVRFEHGVPMIEEKVFGNYSFPVVVTCRESELDAPSSANGKA